MKGFRTIIINVLIAMLGAALPILANVDWTEFVSPTIALVIVAAINVGLRIITTTPIGQSE